LKSAAWGDPIFLRETHPLPVS